MIEGKIYYEDDGDFWYIIRPDGEKRNISNLVYAMSPLFEDMRKVEGEGEYIKINFEIL